GDGEEERRTGGHPGGEVYDWYQRGIDLLARGDAAAAAQLLERAATAEPGSPSIREALARALFDAGRYPRAREIFAKLVEEYPDDDYAHFGLGLSQWRLGDLASAREHLAMASAMRPSASHYSAALGQVRATLDARARAAGSGPGPSDSPGS